MERSNREALFQDEPPNPVSLAWHYNMTVFENMCAVSLEEGGERTWKPGIGNVSIEEDQPSTDTKRTAQSYRGIAQAEQDTEAGIVSSTLLPGDHVTMAPFLDSPQDSDYEDPNDNNDEDWQHGFTLDLDNRLQSLVGLQSLMGVF